MKRIYYLSTCNTCHRIIKTLKLSEDFEFIDIKQSNIDEKMLDWVKNKLGTYEALFSKKALKYKTLNLNEKNLTEEEYKKYMLDEYTFLKRPFIIIGDEVVIGNTKAAIEKAKKMMEI